jgi:hypothetical protein
MLLEVFVLSAEGVVDVVVVISGEEFNILETPTAVVDDVMLIFESESLMLEKSNNRELFWVFV